MALRNYNHLLVEPLVYTDTANSQLVYSYFEATLPKLKPNSVIVLDNASYHKSKKLQALFDTYNCTLLYLSPYSPDLNPIEKLWGTIKRQLRNYYNYNISLYDNLAKVVCSYTV